MITTPKLPPKAGYVERVNADGEHYYEPTAETLAGERIATLESENTLLKHQVTALIDQNDFQEELIVELANIVYA